MTLGLGVAALPAPEVRRMPVRRETTPSTAYQRPDYCAPSPTAEAPATEVFVTVNGYGMDHW